VDTLSREGVALAFEDVGRGAPPLLLIHDLGRDHAAMRAQVARFRRRHRVVAVDLRGHGASGGRAGCLGVFAEDLAWLCYELGVFRPLAVGRGAGAAVARVLAARRPHVLGGVVAVDADLPDEGVNAAVERALSAQGAAFPAGGSSLDEARPSSDGTDSGQPSTW
jgi:pimeloyl-ACP methyl ester carboxylesterase